MIIGGNQISDTDRKRFFKIFERLPEQDRKTLLDFAEFLMSRAEKLTSELPDPKIIPRPKDESVIKALKRLSQTYFMLDKAEMLNETSVLMTQHIMQGRPADEVIDELEHVFLNHYQKLRDDRA